MQAAFHAELDELVAELAKMVRLASQMINNASIALHQKDLALAGLVIADCDQIMAMLEHAEQRCISLLASHSPVAGHWRVIVAAFRVMGHLDRMGNLARHVAIIAGLKHPNPMSAGETRPVLARMSLLASQLADDAATAIEHPDPLSGDQLDLADDEVDTLRHHLHDILFSENWSHGVQQAVNSALIGRYYERFADHAVAIARQAHPLDHRTNTRTGDVLTVLPTALSDWAT